jgi:hypothetical protein
MKVLDLVFLYQENHVLGIKIRLYNVEINIAIFNSKLRINGSLLENI